MGLVSMYCFNPLLSLKGIIISSITIYLSGSKAEWNKSYNMEIIGHNFQYLPTPSKVESDILALSSNCKKY